MTELRPSAGASETSTSLERAPRVVGLLRLLPWLAPYRSRVWLALACLLLAAAATLAVPVLLKGVIDTAMAEPGSDPGGFSPTTRRFVELFVLAGFLALVTAGRYYLVTWLGERVIADVRNAVYTRVLAHSPVFFETTRTGEVLSRLGSDATLVQTVVGSSFSMGLRNLLLFAGSAFMLVATAPRLAVTVMALLAFVVLPAILIGRRVRRLSRTSQDRLADTSAIAAEVLNAMPVVQSHGQQEREARRFSQATELAFRASVRRTAARAGLTAFIIAAAFGAALFGFWSGTQAVIRGEMTAGHLGQTLIYFVMVASSAAVLAEVWGDLLRAAGATERLDELLAAPPAIVSPAQPLEPRSTSDRGAAVRFHALSFRYPSRPDRLALDNLSLSIEPGMTLALVGPSGAGKTTVLQLLCRFYEHESGSLAIDGVPIERWDLDKLRQRVAWVPQDAVIFSADALENIRYGRPDATEEEVFAAARAAQADGFIRDLPQGYRSFLGERGVRLSGGQKQRIAIARAILRNAPLLLLDEATSALDAESERAVQTALETAMRGRTTVVVAHRLATVQRADWIVVMDEGRIVEQGTHAALMAARGLYARLAALQFSVTAAA